MNSVDHEVTILVVDDDPAFLLQAQTYLESEGLRVVTESDGHEVLNSVGKLMPDILLLDLDLGLEDTDGRIICSEISKTTSYQQGMLGVILMSGRYINPADELIGYHAGADNYLTKPFGMPQLLAKIRAVSRLLKNKVQIDAGPGIFSIDFKRREVRVCDTLVPLTRLEYRVLEYMVLADGGVCVKSELLENVWGTLHVEEGAIAKCISLLRTKLAVNSDHPFIETVFGVGYKFNAGVSNAP